MKRKLILTTAALALAASAQVFAAGPLQRIDVVNLLWNSNASNGVQGLTPTSVLVAFNNGGTKPCFSTTLLFQGSTTLLSGTGQPCSTAVTSITFTPVSGPAGLVYAAPAAYTVNTAYFGTQLYLSNGTDPIFDTTNGAVRSQGSVAVTAQGQFAQN